MGVTIPSDLELLEPYDLIGFVRGDDQEPLHTLLRRCNWHYATHRPPLRNSTPHSDVASSQRYIMPVEPSADGLEYQVLLMAWTSLATTLTTVVEYATGSSSGSWTAVTGSPSMAVVMMGDNEVAAFDVTIPASAEFLRVTCSVLLGTVQVQNVLVMPKILTSIAAGVKGCGFVPYDDTHLTSTGAAIHTEYINRGAANFRAVQADRRQDLLTYLQEVTAPKHTWRPAGSLTSYLAAYGVAGLPGQQTTTVTVRLRASDTGSGGTVTIGQINGDAVSFAADDTDQTETLELYGEQPVIYVRVTPDTDLTLVYACVDWSPSIGSPDPLITSAAPPARIEYLSALDRLGLVASVGAYGCPALQTNFYNASGTYWRWRYVVSPATRRMRGIWTRSLNEDGSAATTTEAFNDESGAGGSNRIDIPAPGTGTEVYDPMDPFPAIAWGALNDEATPSGPLNRLHEVVESRSAGVEVFEARYAVGFTGYPEPVADLAAV